MSPDPAQAVGENVAKPRRWNLYAYVLNNPLKFNDPDGRRENPVTRAAGIDPTPQRGVTGKIRSSPSNPNIGKFGPVRKDDAGNRVFHPGLDINASKGTPIHAAEGGTVSDVSSGPKAGNRVQVTMPDGTINTYAHLDSIVQGLKNGDTVREDQLIGRAGITGNAAGLPRDQQHLHFAVTDPSGQPVDPGAWLNDPEAPPPASDARGRHLGGSSPGTGGTITIDLNQLK